MKKETTVTIASLTGTSIWSFAGPFETSQFGFGSTNRHPELAALSSVLQNIPYRQFLNAAHGRNVTPESKLPIVVQTTSQDFIDTVTRLLALDAATMSESPLNGHLARKLQGIDITWELLQPTDHAITDLQEWQAALVQR